MENMSLREKVEKVVEESPTLEEAASEPQGKLGQGRTL